MSHRSISSAGVSVLVLAALVGSFHALRSRTRAEPSSASEAPVALASAPRPEAGALRADFAEMRDQMAQLSASHAALLEHMRDMEISARTAPGDRADTPAEPEPSELVEPAAQPLSPLEQEAQAMTYSAAQLDLLEDTLAGEPDDETWAVEAEDLLLRAYREQELEGAAVDGVQCRSSLCRIVVSFDTAEEAESGLMLALDQIPWAHEAYFHSDHLGDRPTTSLYIAREGQGLPRPSGGRGDF